MLASAMTIAADSSILFANCRFSELIGRPQESVLGIPLARFCAPEDATVLTSLLWHSPLGLFSIVGTVAAFVYILDAKPAIASVTRN